MEQNCRHAKAASQVNKWAKVRSFRFASRGSFVSHFLLLLLLRFIRHNYLSSFYALCRKQPRKINKQMFDWTDEWTMCLKWQSLYCFTLNSPLNCVLYAYLYYNVKCGTKWLIIDQSACPFLWACDGVCSDHTRTRTTITGFRACKSFY